MAPAAGGRTRSPGPPPLRGTGRRRPPTRGARPPVAARPLAQTLYQLVVVIDAAFVVELLEIAARAAGAERQRGLDFLVVGRP